MTANAVTAYRKRIVWGWVLVVIAAWGLLQIGLIATKLSNVESDYLFCLKWPKAGQECLTPRDEYFSFLKVYLPAFLLELAMFIFGWILIRRGKRLKSHSTASN
jgi:hypothetical protein